MDVLIMKYIVGNARIMSITIFDMELMNRVTSGFVKSICIENNPCILFSTKNSKSYIILGIIIPKNFPAIINIAGVNDILRALFSSFDIILGQSF